MSKNLSLHIASSLTSDMTVSEINKKIREIESKLESDTILKIDPKYKNVVRDFANTISKLNETRISLENTIKAVFPNINSKKLTELLIDTALSTGYIDLHFYNKIFDILNKNSNPTPNINLSINIVVNEPSKRKTSLLSFEDFKNVVFTLATGVLLTLYQNYIDQDSIVKKDLLNTQNKIVEQVRVTENKFLSELSGLKNAQNIDYKNIEKQLNEIMNNQEKMMKELNKQK